MEATYAPDRPVHLEKRVGAWNVWAGRGESPELWHWLRRGVKIIAGVLALGCGWALWRRERSERRQLLGGLLAVAAASVLATPLGAVAGLALLLPLALVVMAVRSETTVLTAAVTSPHDLSARLATAGGVSPRITVN